MQIASLSDTLLERDLLWLLDRDPAVLGTMQQKIRDMVARGWCPFVLGSVRFTASWCNAPDWQFLDYSACHFSPHTAKEELPRGSIFEIDIAAFHSSGE